MTQLDDIRARRTPAHQFRMHVDGVPTNVRVPGDQIEEYYRPLSQLVLDLPRSSGRLVIGVAGPPGSGKTVIAGILASMINSADGNDRAVVVGLDGWHFPNAYLASRSVEVGGTQVPLMDIKGSPETFDVAGALSCLARVREGSELKCPVYDRGRHEAVLDALALTKTCTMVIFEGNYVLLDQPPWSRFRRLFDLAVYVSAGQEVIVPALLQRHQQGGKSEEDARRSVLAVDLRNAQLVLPSERYADVVLVKADGRRIARMTIRPGAGNRVKARHG